jgi:hypothetical protein
MLNSDVATGLGLFLAGEVLGGTTAAKAVFIATPFAIVAAAAAGAASGANEANPALPPPPPEEPAASTYCPYGVAR